MVSDQFNKDKIRRELRERSDRERKEFKRKMVLLFGDFYGKRIEKKYI